MKRLFIRALTLLVIGSTVYYVYGIYLKTHVVIMHNSPSLGKEESNYDFISLLKGVRTGTYKTFYPNGQLREEFVIVNGRKNGPSKTYFDNGALRSEDNYKNDQLDGEIKRYEYATGFFFSVNQYKDGLLDGINKWYYPSGAVRSEEGYARGLKHGPTKFYKEDGKLEKIVTYSAKQLTGLTTEFFPDGTTIAAEINYLNGLQDGEATWYFDNGKIKNSTQYKLGRKNGLSQIYYYSGMMSDEKYYLNDELDGNSKTYYNSGGLWYEVGHLKGKLHGPEQRYYPNGKIETIKTYAYGQLNGPYTLYDETGKIRLDIELEKGRIKKIRTDNILVNNTLEDIAAWHKATHFGSIVRFLLHSRQFDKLERLFAMINSSPETRNLMNEEYFSDIKMVFGAVSPTGSTQEFFALLDAWKDAYPQSIAQYLTRIGVLTNIAWNYRGSYYADATPAASFEKFAETLREAEQLIKEALELPEKNPNLYSLWIWVSLGLSHPDRVTQHIFEQGIAMDKLYFNLYQDRLVSLLPKWGGGKEEVERFIKSSVEKLDEPDGKELYTHLINTLIDMDGREFFLKFDLDRNQLLDSYYYVMLKNPDDRITKNRFAWLATQYQDKERAVIAFQMMDNDDFIHDVWNYDDFLAAGKWASSDEDITIVSDIHHAVTRGDMVQLYLYLKRKGDINAKDNKKQTLLLTALNSQQPDLATYLIDSGADVNKTDEYGESPLHAAAERGYTSIIRRLIDRKAIVKKFTSTNVTPLHEAAERGYQKIAELLLMSDRSILNLKTDSGRTAFLAACQNAQTDFVRMLMEYKELELNQRNNDGYNCMHFAVYKGAEDLVKLLLKTDVDYLQQKNSKGETPLDAAVKANHTEIIRLLNESLPAPVAVPAAPTEAVIPAL